MAVAKSLPFTDPFFIQTCPLCAQSQRMMIRGLYVHKGQSQLYPDMGYSFCNCRNIFYTKWENVVSQDGGFNSCKEPLIKLQSLFDESTSGQTVLITMRDPYFCIWTRPHEYTGFNPRVNYVLWDMDSWARECERVGFEVVSKERDMDVESKTPECYHIKLRKP